MQLTPNLTVCVWLLAITLLAGCSSKTDDIRAWMREQKESSVAAPSQQPPTPQKTIEYKPSVDIDPFDPRRATDDRKRQEQESQLHYKTKEIAARTLRGNPLEKFALAEIRMVGYMNTGKKPVGIVSADNTLYRVQVGDYIGQNFGVIEAIGDNEIRLRERVVNDSGKWTERKSMLSLNADQGGKTR